jgi:hypothetical protein
MHLQDSIAIMARQYVRSILSSVQRMSMTISPSQSGLNTGHKIISGFPEAATLVQWICQSYQYVHLSFSIHFQAFYCQGSCARVTWIHVIHTVWRTVFVKIQCLPKNNTCNSLHAIAILNNPGYAIDDSDMLGPPVSLTVAYPVLFKIAMAPEKLFLTDKLISNLRNIRYMCRYHLGLELVPHSDEAGESLLRMFWDHQDAILCCSFKVVILHTCLS